MTNHMQMSKQLMLNTGSGSESRSASGDGSGTASASRTTSAVTSSRSASFSGTSSLPFSLPSEATHCVHESCLPILHMFFNLCPPCVLAWSTLATFASPFQTSQLKLGIAWNVLSCCWLAVWLDIANGTFGLMTDLQHDTCLVQ